MQGGCIREKVAVFGKLVSIREKRLFLGKSGFIRQSGYIWAIVFYRAKVDVFGQSGCIPHN